MKNISTYIDHLQRHEQYAFSREQLKSTVQKTDLALKSELMRLSDKKEIISLRKGFYLILPPRYKHLGKLPLKLYVHQLFESMERPYYVSLYSAAAIHGASHQQIQAEYVTTTPPKLRDIQKQNIHLNFFTTQHWPQQNITKQKSDAGYYLVSSPALTAADLIKHQRKIGGLDRVYTVLEELMDIISSTDLKELVTWYPYASIIQRLGYLLENLGASENQLQPIRKHLHQMRYYPVALNHIPNYKAGKARNSWKVDANIEPESDL